MNGIDAKYQFRDELSALATVAKTAPELAFGAQSQAEICVRAFCKKQCLPLDVDEVRWNADREAMVVSFWAARTDTEEVDECLAALQDLLEGVAVLKRSSYGTLTLTNEPALMYAIHVVGSRAKVKPSHRPLPAHHALLKPRGSKGKPARW